MSKARGREGVSRAARSRTSRASPYPTTASWSTSPGTSQLLSGIGCAESARLSQDNSREYGSEDGGRDVRSVQRRDRPRLACSRKFSVCPNSAHLICGRRWWRRRPRCCPATAPGSTGSSPSTTSLTCASAKPAFTVSRALSKLQRLGQLHFIQRPAMCRRQKSPGALGRRAGIRRPPPAPPPASPARRPPSSPPTPATTVPPPTSSSSPPL